MCIVKLSFDLSEIGLSKVFYYLGFKIIISHFDFVFFFAKFRFLGKLFRSSIESEICDSGR